MRMIAPNGRPGNPLPFDAIPRELATDPKLAPATRAKDYFVVGRLLFHARQDDHTTVADGTIAREAGWCIATVQRSLSRLEAAGWIRRERNQKTRENATGRVIVLCWRAGAKPDDILAHFRALPYAEYLKTAHWREVRDRALVRSGRACAICPATTRLEVHHRTYERLGAEADSDVVVLCRDCHGLFHGKVAK